MVMVLEIIAAVGSQRGHPAQCVCSRKFAPQSQVRYVGPKIPEQGIHRLAAITVVDGYCLTVALQRVCERINEASAVGKHIGRADFDIGIQHHFIVFQIVIDRWI